MWRQVRAGPLVRRIPVRLKPFILVIPTGLQPARNRLFCFFAASKVAVPLPKPQPLTLPGLSSFS